MKEEKISIIMGVYNCSDTINEAIDSIINQTYQNWEFIICDDASTDSTYEILMKYKEKRPDNFIILKNKTNLKLAYSLNHCLKYTTGNYIARMDGDDISDPNRFERQIVFLRDNESIDLVGTSMQRFNDKGEQDIVYSIEKPNRYTLRNKIPFYHATIMTYKSVFDRLEGYTVTERTKRSQDHDLWFRFFREEFIGRNILTPLYYVREDSAAVRRRTIKVRFNAYKTTIIGYKMLKYPIHWYIPATIKFLVKSLTPYFIIDLYRKYQRSERVNRFK